MFSLENINVFDIKRQIDNLTTTIFNDYNISYDDYQTDINIKNRVADLGLDYFKTKCNDYDNLPNNEYIILCFWIISQYCSKERVKDIINSWFLKIDNQFDKRFGKYLISAVYKYDLNQYYFNNNLALIKRYNAYFETNDNHIITVVKNNINIIDSINDDNYLYLLQQFNSLLQDIDTTRTMISICDDINSIFYIVNYYYHIHCKFYDEIIALYNQLFNLMHSLDKVNLYRLYNDTILNEITPVTIKEYIQERIGKYIKDGEILCNYVTRCRENYGKKHLLESK